MTEIKKGDRFGMWTVIEPSKNKKYHFTCKCDCGSIKDVYRSSLLLGRSTSCGCSQKEKWKIDIDVGYRKDKLEVIAILSSKKLLCKCDCGSTVEMTRSQILPSSSTSSCGCVRRELAKKTSRKPFETGSKLLKELHHDGTLIVAIDGTRKKNKNNTTGVKGVSRNKDGRYRAYITLRRKQKHLGVFNTLEEAKLARKEAEELYYKPIVEDWENR